MSERDETIRRHALHVANIEHDEACPHGVPIAFDAVRPAGCDDCQDEHAVTVATEAVGK